MLYPSGYIHAPTIMRYFLFLVIIFPRTSVLSNINTANYRFLFISIIMVYQSGFHQRKESVGCMYTERFIARNWLM